MKNLLPLTMVLLATVFSCSNEEAYEIQASNELPILILNNESKASTSSDSRFVLSGENNRNISAGTINKIDCYDQHNVEMFIPLSDVRSGFYPEAGSESDRVTLTPESPTSSGMLDIELKFDEVYQRFGNATLSLTFDDLDLKHDYITAGNNVVQFNEKLTIKDSQGNILTTLDERHRENGNFSWEFDIPNEVFLENNTDKSMSFHLIFEANLELLEGDGVQIMNTIEALLDIKLCGSVMGGIE